MRGLLCFAAVVVFATGCTEIKSGALGKLFSGHESSDQLISDRPQNQDRFFATVKLTQPALLQTVRVNEQGQRVVNPDTLQALIAEQEFVIAELKKISPDIQVVYRYKMVMNALALILPTSIQERVANVSGVRAVMPAQKFARPQVVMSSAAAPTATLAENNSVAFIEAQKVWKELKVKDVQGHDIPVDGTNMSVGIIDTGIDYTHKMLGGPGTEEAFKGIDPKQPSSLFPNAKVVGGVDLVGTDFDAASDVFSKQIPTPDANPIDEAAHGTHVAGTVAGIGDNINTYNGVAPGAKLHAIKVFGADGSTSDIVVVAALEYAADPNGDFLLNDQLSVVNLSLGGGYGQPQILYREAINNLSQGGTVVVASAGNSGPEDFIVGAPSTSDDAVSVAASIDDMPKNWSFPAVKFVTSSNTGLLAKAVEGNITKPIADAGDVKGDLVSIGLADQPLSDDVKAKLKGQIALIDRGVVPFLQKLQLAFDAGAIGAVVANNVPGDPIRMGGEGHVDIPAIMITKGLGDELKAELEKGFARIEFRTGEKIADPNLIDTLTDFSSKGPRSQDALIKPEITAPGYEIISAMMGSGDKGVEFSGTSMSGPHITGVMTLLKQYRQNLNSKQLKSVLMSTAVSIDDINGQVYPISRQGAGRVRTFKAATTPVVLDETALSLGLIQLSSGKIVRKIVQVTNTSAEPLTLDFEAQLNASIKMDPVAPLTVGPNESKAVAFNFTLSSPANEQAYTELDGLVLMKSKGEELARLPVLAVVTKLSSIVAKDLVVKAGSANEAAHAVAELTLENTSSQAGMAYLFNLLGVDQRKSTGGHESTFRSRECDLQAAGYRIVEMESDGVKEKVLQVGVKLYRPMTTWHYCEISVQIDNNGDELADQELGGVFAPNIAGVGANLFASVLLDAVKVREIRKQYETDLAAGKETMLNYGPAIQDAAPMLNFAQSSVAIVQVRLSSLNLRDTGELAIKVATLNGDTDAIEADDFLADQLENWQLVDPDEHGAGFYGMPQAIQIPPGLAGKVSFAKGEGRNPLLVLFPTNKLLTTGVGMDEQAIVLEPQFSMGLF